MNIRPKNIPKFQSGGVPLWYLDRYGNRTSLLNWNLNKRYNYSNKNLNTNDHRNAGNLDTVYRKNLAYTRTPGAISSDIQSFYNSDGKNMSAQDFVDFYNKNAAEIRSHWNLDLIYNAKTAGKHNRLFKRMFASRSDLSMSPGSDYNIGYQNNLEDIEGSSTWLRRMDLYENEFDLNNVDSNRLHEITLSDGTKAVVYKKANGDIGLYSNKTNTNPQQNPEGTKQVETTSGGINSTETKDKESLLSKLGAGLKNVAPDLLDALRLAGNMHNNERVYNESLKTIIPNLLQSYHTYRQVVGDEATKQGFYRRAAQGLTRAARPFTSDADRQVAYMNEAKRIGDELRAQGDLADNQEIRRTSDESNQHQWANIQRDTEVANNNTTEINKAKAARHQLTAQKYSADWTNLDLFLLGKLAKLEQEKAKLKALLDLIWTLLTQNELENNPTYLALLKAVDDAWNKSKDSNPANDPNVKEALLKLKNWKTQWTILALQSRPSMAKSGTKLTYKDNTDKYLYKTSKDIVEHFRKMSKMTDDSRVKTLPKTVKLSSHPRKMLLGGVAPFTVYRPLGVGGESAVSTQTSDSTSSKSSKDTAAKDKLDMIKELFKSVQGLPIDASKVYSLISGLLSKYKAFGEEMSTDDIASMYLSAMNQINHLKYSQDAYNKAHALAVANDALNEIAVGANGELYVQNMETGEIKRTSFSSLKDLEGNWNPLNNSLLLTMRAHSPNLAFNDDVFNVVNNGIGLTKIAAQIKSMAALLGSSTEKIEGITEVESKLVKAGLEILAGTKGTPDGHYLVTNNTKQQTLLVKAALNYIYTMLPKNYKTILNIHSNGLAESLIASFLASLVDNVVELTITPLTGKASKNGSNNDGSEGLKLDAATALVTGKGYKTEIELNPGSNYAVKALGRFSEFQKKSGENMGAGTTMLEATESTIKGNLDWNKATIGGSRIIPTAYNQVILNNGEVAGIDLPVDPNNPDAPNFEILKQLENLDKLLKLNNIEDSELNWKKVNEICDKIGIPHKYDSNGKLNLTLWKRFAAFLVTTPDTALVNKNVILDMVGIASKEERDLYNNFILNKTNNKNFELSDTFLGFGHRDELYKGTVFVPIKESIVASAISGGLNIYMNLATDLELREQGYDSSKVKSYKKSEYSL